MEPERLLLADTHARKAALEISRSFVVQAPAGSGKTELLIQRYLALLAIVESPEQILAITFTRKAALEMSNRVVSALRDGLTAGAPQEAHRRLTMDLAKSVLRRDDELGWRLAESPRRLRIQTLDSFCAGLARSLPVSSGLGGALTTLADAEMHTMYRNAAAATLDWLLADDYKANDVALLLEHLDNNTGAYIEHIARMLESRDQWLDLVGGGTSISPESSNAARSSLEKSLARFVTTQLFKLQQSFDASDTTELLALLRYGAEQLLRAGMPDHPLQACREILTVPGHATTDLVAWRAISGLLLKADGDWRKTVTKNDGFPPADNGEKKKLQEILATLAGNDTLRARLQRVRLLPDTRFDQQQWQVLLALLRILPIAVAELRRLFGERSVSDHTEVALAAGVALGDPEQPGDAALRIDYALRHILVDETQDTSVNQYKLIEKLLGGWTPGDGRTLFCVGDPMQSIYRFRDAEVGRFLQIRKSGIGSVMPEPLVLRRNFRSGENLVHWFNTVFSQLFPIEDDIADGAISYAESVHDNSKSGQGACQVYPLFGANADDEASQVVKVLRESIGRVTNQTSALLVRSRSQLPTLLRHLRDAGIEYRAVEIDRLTDLPEVADLIALTRALCHEGDRLAWLALLRAPWVGLTWTELHKLVLNDVTSTVPELLADKVRFATLTPDAQQRVDKLLALLGEHARQRMTRTLRDRLELVWFALGGPALLQNQQQLENVYRYLDIVENLESAGTLMDVQELESRLDEVRVSSVVDSTAALQVMTMHKAKGLEFDNVILYALGRSTRGRTRPILSWMNVADDDGNFDMLLSPIGPRAVLENDRLHQCIEVVESEKQKLELDRLLYVACTRARHSLHLIGNVPLKAGGEDFVRPAAGSLLDRLWPALEQRFKRAFQGGQGICSGDESTGSRFAAPLLQRFRKPYLLPAPPQLPVTRARPERVGISSDVEYYWVGMTARHAGTIVHALLKSISNGQAVVDADSVGTLRNAVTRMAGELGVSGEALVEVTTRVEESIRGILDDSRGRWLVSGEGYAELPLTGLWDDRVASIVIDRVRVDGGVHWIVDYKTSTHEGGDLECFLRQEEDRYRPQLEKYVTIYRRTVDAEVRAALYFPLLKAFREVPISVQRR